MMEFRTPLRVGRATDATKMAFILHGDGHELRIGTVASLYVGASFYGVVRVTNWEVVQVNKLTQTTLDKLHPMYHNPVGLLSQLQNNLGHALSADYTVTIVFAEDSGDWEESAEETITGDTPVVAIEDLAPEEEIVSGYDEKFGDLPQFEKFKKKPKEH